MWLKSFSGGGNLPESAKAPRQDSAGQDCGTKRWPAVWWELSEVERGRERSAR